MSLQTCSNVTVEDVAMFGECCPSGRNFYLNLLVLVFVSGIVSLSQVVITTQSRYVLLTYYAYHSQCIQPMVRMLPVLW